MHGGLDAPNRETLPVVGQKQIHNRIQQLNFRDCHAKISQVDAQATLGKGVVVQVTGELSNGGAPMRRFTQTFVLAAQSPKKYYVHNDIFRYQDIVFSDEEGDGSGRSDAEEEDAQPNTSGGYFPPPPAAFPPAAFPAPPAPPLAPPSPPPPAPLPSPAPHVNGHPPAEDAPVEAPDPGAGGGEPAPDAPESRAPSPPAPAVPPAAPEPKTYANLLKSGGAPPRASPPQAAPEPRARPPRARDAPPGEAAAAPAPRRRAPPADAALSAADGARRYSDAQQLFLGNLPHSATEDELRALFARYGPVAELRVHSKPAAPGAPRHPNYGFITYETAQAAHDCLNAAVSVPRCARVGATARSNAPLARQPLFFPVEGADSVKLNVEEKKTRGREPPRRRPLSSHRERERAQAPPFRQPSYRRA